MAQFGSSGGVADLSGVPKLAKHTNAAFTGGTVSVLNIGTIDLTLTAATPALALSNPTAGQYVGLIVRQDGTGGRGLTVTGADWGAVTPRWNTVADAVSIAALFYDGTEWQGLHNNRIREIVWHGDAGAETYGDRWRFDVRSHLIAASFDCDDPPTGGPWIADLKLKVPAGSFTSIYPNDGARPQIAAGADDGGVIATHTTLVAPAGSRMKAITKTPGSTNPGAYGTLRLAFVEEA